MGLVTFDFGSCYAIFQNSIVGAYFEYNMYI